MIAAAGRLLLANWKLLLVAVLLAALGAQTVRVSNARAEVAQARAALAENRATYAQAAQKAEKAERAKERQRQEDNERIRREATEQTAAADAAARDSADAAERLRQRVAALVAASRGAGPHPTAGGRGPGQQDTAALDLLADVFSRADAEAGILAAYADRLYIAGSACERVHQSLRPAGQ